ncbi:MAG: hypothetical protein PHU23_09700 [Dehalococcoidales bacterium]|nr:hypothetical protein [Dehalococcoidales bacterium]
MAEYLYTGTLAYNMSANYTKYGTILGECSSVFNNETYGQTRIRDSAVWSCLGLLLYSSTTDFTLTLTSRINGANGNQSISVAAGLTGWFEDAVNSDTLTDGDLINYIYSAPAGTGTAYPSQIQCKMVSDSFIMQVSEYGYVYDGGSYFQTLYGYTCNEDSENALVEAENQAKFYPGGSLSNLRAYSDYNGITDTSEIVLRVNGADGNQLLSIPDSTTGEFEDTVNSDVIAAGSLVCWQIRGGATGSDELDLTLIQMKVVSTGQILGVGGNDYQITEYYNGTWYLPLQSGDDYEYSDEAKYQHRIKSAFTAKNLYVYLKLNSVTGATYRTRLNGANGNLIISFPPATTGAFEDIVDSDNLGDGDLYCGQLYIPTDPEHPAWRVEPPVIQIELEPVAGLPPDEGNAFSSLSTKMVTAGLI